MMQDNFRKSMIWVGISMWVVITVITFIIVVNTHASDMMTQCLGLWEFLAFQSAINCLVVIVCISSQLCTCLSRIQSEFMVLLVGMTTFIAIGALSSGGIISIVTATQNKACMNEIGPNLYIITASSSLLAIDTLSFIATAVIGTSWIYHSSIARD